MKRYVYVYSRLMWEKLWLKLELLYADTLDKQYDEYCQVRAALDDTLDYLSQAQDQVSSSLHWVCYEAPP